MIVLIRALILILVVSGWDIRIRTLVGIEMDLVARC